MDFIPPATTEELEELTDIVCRIITEGATDKIDAMMVFKCLILVGIALDALDYASKGMTVDDAIGTAVLERKEAFK